MPPGPVLILATPDDPFAAAFRQATAGLVECWQPADLSEIGWSVTLANGTAVRLIDRATGRSWASNELGGIWFQALPAFASIEALEERDRQYVIAEVRSSLAAVWRQAACPVIGQPTRDGIEDILGPGPEARISLQQLGLPSATMLLGPATIRREGRETEVRLSPLGNAASRWLDPNQQDPENEWALTTTTAIASADRSARVIAVVGTSIRVFNLADTGEVSDACTTEADEAIAERIRTATDLELALAFCVRQGGEWRITRLSSQLPWWLAAVPGITDWITAWLTARFTVNRAAAAGIGHTR